MLRKIWYIVKLIMNLLGILRRPRDIPGPVVPKDEPKREAVTGASWLEFVRDENTNRMDVHARTSQGATLKIYQDVYQTAELAKLLALHPNAGTFLVRKPAPQPEPDTGKTQWESLIQSVKASAFGSDEVKAALLAQCILESGRGTSMLAARHNNFAGLKYREELKSVATKVLYRASDGEDYYCAFVNTNAFVVGYFRFVGREVYKGWEQHKDSAEQYIAFLKSKGYATDPNYVSKVIERLPEARKLLGQSSPGRPTGEYQRPTVHATILSRKKSSRGGKKVSLIVGHYTSGATLQGAIETLTTGSREASAHYIIGRGAERIKDPYTGRVYDIPAGGLVLLVPEHEKAWHAGNVNPYSIGIEHVALQGQRMTAAQEKTSVALCKYLMKKYGLSYKQYKGHNWTPGNATICPSNLYGSKGTEAEMEEWVRDRFAKEFPG